MRNAKALKLPLRNGAAANRRELARSGTKESAVELNAAASNRSVRRNGRNAQVDGKLSHRDNLVKSNGAAAAKPDGYRRAPERLFTAPGIDIEAAFQRYSDLYDFAPIPYVSFSRSGRIEDVNLAATQLLGRPRSLLIGSPFSLFVSRRDTGVFLEHLSRCRTFESQVASDLRLKNRQGDVLFVHLSSRPVTTLLLDGAIHFQTAIVDLTERKKTEQRLAAQARLLELTSDAVIVRDRKGRIQYWNTGAEKLYGYSREEAVGQITHELLKTEHPESLRKIDAKFRRDQRWEGELIHYHKDGRPIATLSRWALDLDPEGGVTILETNTDITERKQVTLALRQREDFLRRLIDTAPMCIKVLAPDGTLLQMNTSGVRLLEANSPAELEGKCFYEVIAPEYRDAFRRFNERICRGTKGSVQFEIVGLKGGRRFMETYAVPLRWFDGRRVQLAVTNDITERRRADEAIRDSERRFRELIDALPAAVYTTDAEGRLTHFNQTCIELSGKIPKLGTDRWCVSWKLYYPDGRQMPHCECPMAIALKTGEAIRGAEVIAERPDGSRIWFNPYPTPLRDSRGRIVGGINMLVDITARKLAEKRIHESQERLRAIIAQSAVGVTRCDFEGRILLTNPAFSKLVGYSEEELLRKNLRDLTHPEDLKATRDVLVRIANGQTPIQYQKRYIRKNGSIVWTNVSISAIRDAHGKPESGIGMVIDITARKQAEDALRESEEQMRAIIEQAVAGIARADREGRMFFVNQQFCEMVGYTEAELLGTDATQFTHPDDIKITADLFKRLVSKGEAFEVEKRYIRKDGSILWVNVSVAPIRNALGQIQSAVAVVVNINDRKKAESQLRRSKQMLEELVEQRTKALRESNEELENEITRRRGLEGQILELSDREQQRLAQELHDGLCQELTAIGFMARATALRVKDHRVLDPADLEQIATLVSRAATDARNISRALHRVDVDALGLVEALENLATREIWKTPCRLEAKRGFQIEDDRVAINLYGIAREAVVNANKHARAQQIVIRLAQTKSETILSISDDGVGLKPQRQKSPSMGLHIMDYRARSIGGRLVVESPKGGGTRVICSVPSKK